MEQDPSDPTGVRETSGSVQKATGEARRRKAAMAANLYVEKHKTLKFVAEKCGYPDAGAARVAIENYLKDELNEHPHSLALMRDMAGRRLDNLNRMIAKKALNPKDPEHLAAAREYRANVVEWINLYGLKAPQQLVISNPTSEAITEIAMQLAQQGAPDVIEGDIFSDDAPDDEILALEARAAQPAPESIIVEAVLVGDLEQETSNV